MVFDLPLFRLEPTEPVNSHLDSALHDRPSITHDGGSKTPPYFGISNARHTMDAG
jgi:hypothetical protein